MFKELLASSSGCILFDLAVLKFCSSDEIALKENTNKVSVSFPVQGVKV